MPHSSMKELPPEFSTDDVFSPPGADSGELSLRKILQILRRRWRSILIWTLACAAIAGLVTSLMTPYYRASTTIEIESKQSSALSNALSAVSSEFSGEQDLRVEVQTDINIFQNDTLCLETIDRSHYADHLNQLRRNRPITAIDLTQQSKPSATRESLLQEFRRRVVITPIQSTRLITVAFDDPDPRYAATVANALVQQFVDDRLLRRNITTEQSSKSMSDEIDTLRRQVQQAQQRLSDYQRSSGLIATPLSVGSEAGRGGTATDPLLDRLTHVNQDLASAESSRILRQAIYEIAKNGSTSDISSLAAQTGNSSLESRAAGLQSLEQQRGTLRQEIASVILTYGDRNPHLVDLNQRLTEVEKEIQEHRNLIKSNAKADYEIARQTENGLQKQYDYLTRQANAKNDSQIKLAVLQQEANSSRAIYLDLFTKLQESKLAENTQASNISVIGLAMPPAHAAHPRMATSLGLGTLAGFVIGIILAFILDSLDDTIATGHQVEALTGLPLLGNVSQFQQHEEQGGTRGTFKLDAQAEESYRALRNVLLLSQPGSQPKSLLVTSSLPSEGKTTTTYHLANTFAVGGKRVLAIDSDFRRPSLHKQFNVSNTAGLSNVLTSSVSPDDLVHPSPTNPSLHLLPSGPLPPNPGELLESAQFQELLRHFDGLYDLIILDTPPLMLFTDAVTLSRFVEGVILITRWKQTSVQTLRRTAELLQRNRIRPRGFVVNSVNTSSVDHYYNYGYYGTNYMEGYRDSKRS